VRVHWVVKGLWWTCVLLLVVVGGQLAWCSTEWALDHDHACAPWLVPERPPIYEAVAAPLIACMALWRAKRRAAGLDQAWDWLHSGEGEHGAGPPGPL
jgi:hypothetical protein